MSIWVVGYVMGMAVGIAAGFAIGLAAGKINIKAFRLFFLSKYRILTLH